MADNAKLVTDELVAQVAEKLTAAGERVSNRAVWSAIGGGSMTTISASLRRWRERQELQPAQQIERAPLPDDVRGALENAGDLLWAAAQRETQGEIDDLTAAMNERINKAQGERDVALGELQAALEELEAAKVNIAEQAAAAAAAVADAERLTAEVAQLKQDVAAQTEIAHTASAALAESKRHADHLSGLIAQERTERVEAISRAATAEQQVAALTAQEAAQSTRADELAERLQRVEKRAEALDQRVQAAEGEAKEAIRDAGAQRTAAEAARAEAAEARHEAKEAQEAARAALAAADELRAQLAAQQQAQQAQDEELADLVKKAGEKQQPNKG